MAFIFTCGTHTFTSQLEGYEHITAQCQNCGNHSAKVFKRWQWFTFCFVPLIPFSLKPWHEVGCRICNFWQDIKFRPDIEQAKQGNPQIPLQGFSGSGPGGPGVPVQSPGGAPPQGWGAQGVGQQQQQQGYRPPPNTGKPQTQYA